MSAGKPRPPSNDWRAHPPTGSQYTREWRGARKESSQWISRATKLRLAGAALFVVLAAIIFLFVSGFNSRPAAQLVTIGIGAYDHQGSIPVNPFGERDASAFAELHETNPLQFPSVQQNSNELSGGKFLSFLEDQTQDPKLAGRNLIVFCTLHAVVQSSGDVEFFAIDAVPSDGTNMISLNQLLDRLQKSLAIRVLLVLDTSHVDADWRMGILENDVSAQIASQWPPREYRTTSENSKQDKISILLAASPGEHSWPANERSSISVFLLEGLKGNADGWERKGNDIRQSSELDQRVSLRELAAFISSRVNQWSQQHYGVPQAPQLLGNISDFDLVSAIPMVADAISIKKDQQTKSAKGDVTETGAASKGDKPATGDVDAGKAAPTIDWSQRLTELWVAHDRLREDAESGEALSKRHRQPFAWRAFESRLKLAETYKRSGLQELAPEIVRQADELYERIAKNSNSSIASAFVSDVSQTLQEIGLLETPVSTDPKAIAATQAYLISLAKELGNEKPNAANSNPAVGMDPPDPSLIQAWLKQQLLQFENVPQLKQIVDRLRQLNQLPSTPDCCLIVDAISSPRMTDSNASKAALKKVFSLRDRFRRLMLEFPESQPRIHETIVAGMNSLRTAEWWLFKTNADRPEIGVWLDRSKKAADDAESIARRNAAAISVWSDFLTELPSAAQWIAARAADETQRKLNWDDLRKLSRNWIEQEGNGNWDVDTLVNLLPNSPTRLSELERGLLTLFIDSQKLKSVLLTQNVVSVTPETISQLVEESIRHRIQFWKLMESRFPEWRVGDSSKGAAAQSVRTRDWQDAYRLVVQPWLKANRRREFSDLLNHQPSGEILSIPSPENRSLWQGFWAIASLRLLSRDLDDSGVLWRKWEEMVDRSMLSSTSAESRMIDRAQLGHMIADQWSKLESTSLVPEVGSLSAWYLVAASLDPAVIPIKSKDPDVKLYEQRKKQFATSLTAFGVDWKLRADRYKGLAERLDGVMRSEGIVPATVAATDQAQIAIQSLPVFDAERRIGTLKVSIPSEGRTAGQKIMLAASDVTLQENGASSPIDQGLYRAVAAAGELTFELKLKSSVTSPKPLLIVLTDSDDTPLNFYEIVLNPPFDRTKWNIQLVDGATNTSLETFPLLGSSGVKVLLPPAALLSLKVDLVRPVNDTSRSATVSISRLKDESVESSREVLFKDLKLALEEGKERTPILFDLPAKTKEPGQKLPSSDEPLADVSHGWEFEITPEGQAPLHYLIRPAFMSATNFILDPQPSIVDDRFTLEVKRPVAKTNSALIPAKIKVDLVLPDQLKSAISKTQHNLSTPLIVDQTATLSFPVPRESADTHLGNWEIALNVGGLPHAYRWQISSTGILKTIERDVPAVRIRLILPQTDAKAPPRFTPVIRKGEEPLHLQFQVDAPELDKGNEAGEWTLSYEIVGDTGSGQFGTGMKDSWRLYSSLNRRVIVTSIEKGVWKLRTTAEDFERKEELVELSGRYLVKAQLARTNRPEQPLGEPAELMFAIDDDQPPEVTVSRIGGDGPRPIDQDLSIRIDAADAQSGITNVKFGFDENDDGKLQDREKISERQFTILKELNINWNPVIKASNLPKLSKDQETKSLIVSSENGRGIMATKILEIPFIKVMKPVPKALLGTLVVKLKNLSSGKITIEIKGPDLRKKEEAANTETFADLKPGRYVVKASVLHASTGLRQAGEEEVDVVSGEKKTLEVSLSNPK